MPKRTGSGAPLASDVLPALGVEPPRPGGTLIIGDDYVMPSNWRGKIELHATDREGNLILHKSSLAANTYYNDTITFATGCYNVYLFDAGEDGLSFWANPGQGSGFFRIKKVSDGCYRLSARSNFINKTREDDPAT